MNIKSINPTNLASDYEKIIKAKHRICKSKSMTEFAKNLMSSSTHIHKSNHPIQKPNFSMFTNPESKPVFFGFGGNLCFGHINLAKTLQSMFPDKNVAIYTKDIDVINKVNYKSLSEESKSKPSVLKNKTAYVISPSYTHANYVEKLSKINQLKGVYVDKPICISSEELAKIKTLDPYNIYAGDHYYFGNIAALRLLGVDMPYRYSVKILQDNTKNLKFSRSINDAIPYFTKSEIKSIKTIMHETDDGNILRSRPWYTNENGGGILLDFQLHVHNLLNLMGLKLTSINEAKGLKLPISKNNISSMNEGVALKNLPHFDKFDKTSVEEAVWAKGAINGKIPFEMDTVRGIKDNTRVIIVKGKSGETIKISASSSKKLVELLDKQDNVIASAITDGEPYSLMFSDVEEKLANKDRYTSFLKSLWNAQINSIEQIFDIKKLLGNLWTK